MNKLLEMSRINVSFSGVKVLNNVQIDLNAGEVHALLGENGAGKSTLIKVLGGIYKKDSGTIKIEGSPAEINSVNDAREYGISIIHQELMLVPDLSISENIFLGRRLRNKSGFVDTNSEVKHTQDLLDKYGVDVSAKTLIKDITIAKRQMVEIIKAVSFGVKILVMDEPTSSLDNDEVEVMFDMIRKLKEESIGIIYISHRMAELDVIADRVTILRDGKYIITSNMSDIDHDTIVAHMVGRSMSQLYTRANTPSEEVVLSVSHISDGNVVNDVSFDLHKGEILGFAGLVGSGRSETMMSLFGLSKRTRGTVKIRGQEVFFENPRQAMKGGLGLVPEDRKLMGIFPAQSVRFNATITVLKQFINHCMHDIGKEKTLTQNYVDKMKIKVTSMEQPISALSGGNQQKVIISRWLLANEDILIVDEPTRGVDIATKADIYKEMDELTSSGTSILMISSELPELLNMCDRIVVLNEGVSTKVLNKDEFSQETIMYYATLDVKTLE